MKIPVNRSRSLAIAGALALLAAPAFADFHDDIDSYLPATQIVGQGGWDEWSAGAGALVSSVQALSLGNSIDIKGPSDLVHTYKGYTSGTWTYTAWQYIPTGLTAKSYFILMSKFDKVVAANNKWAVQVGFNPVTGNVEADAGASGAVATTPIIYDKWIEIRVVINLDSDWTKFYYNGVLLDAATVPDHPTLGGGWSWSGGPTGTYNGPKVIDAVDLYANNATSVFYDEISLMPVPSWRDDFDMYAATTQVVGQGGWDEWGPGAGAVVASTQTRGPGNSIDIKGPSDLVHTYSAYTSGTWEYTAWQYIPKGLSAMSYFILLSRFDKVVPANNVWAVQVGFNPVTGNVEADAGGNNSVASTPIIYDKWVEIKVIIHLDADWTQFYYNGLLLDSALVADHPTLGGGYAWTGGPFGSSAGPKAIGAVDLYANNATSVYYDDLSLRAAPRGVTRYGLPTMGANGYPSIRALGDAVAGNTTFGLGCSRAPSPGVGILLLAGGGFPAGVKMVGINLLVNPVPFLVATPVASDSAGMNVTPAPLPLATIGQRVFAQFVWFDQMNPLVLSASDALNILIQ